jgi:hypothetical protein
MLTDAEVDTAVVETANVALVLPAATVTDEGTDAAEELLLDKETASPPLGAALLSVSVPWELVPPVTLVGFRLTEPNSIAGETVRVAI